MQISLTMTATLRREHGMKGSPYLAEIALWPPGRGTHFQLQTVKIKLQP